MTQRTSFPLLTSFMILLFSALLFGSSISNHVQASPYFQVDGVIYRGEPSKLHVSTSTASDSWLLEISLSHGIFMETQTNTTTKIVNGGDSITVELLIQESISTFIVFIHGVSPFTPTEQFTLSVHQATSQENTQQSTLQVFFFYFLIGGGIALGILLLVFLYMGIQYIIKERPLKALTVKTNPSSFFKQKLKELDKIINELMREYQTDYPKLIELRGLFYRARDSLQHKFQQLQKQNNGITFDLVEKLLLEFQSTLVTNASKELKDLEPQVKDHILSKLLSWSPVNLPE